MCQSARELPPNPQPVIKLDSLVRTIPHETGETEKAERIPNPFPISPFVPIFIRYETVFLKLRP